jgi:hypothetical protein
MRERETRVNDRRQRSIQGKKIETKKYREEKMVEKMLGKVTLG